MKGKEEKRGAAPGSLISSLTISIVSDCLALNIYLLEASSTLLVLTLAMAMLTKSNLTHTNYGAHSMLSWISRIGCNISVSSWFSLLYGSVWWCSIRQLIAKENSHPHPKTSGPYKDLPGHYVNYLIVQGKSKPLKNLMFWKISFNPQVFILCSCQMAMDLAETADRAGHNLEWKHFGAALQTRYNLVLSVYSLFAPDKWRYTRAVLWFRQSRQLPRAPHGSDWKVR